MPTVTITGGTGFIGTALTSLLISKGYDVIVLSRHPAPGPGGPFQTFLWDPAKHTIDRQAIENTDYIVNLAGAGIADKRWSKKRKQEIVHSRVQSGETIVKALNEIPNKVKAVINSSAIGWYGPDPVIPNLSPFTENAPFKNDYLGDTVHRWEESIEPVAAMGKRLVKLRTGIVLGSGGGALKEFMKPVRMGLGAILGSGRQMMSWIHIDDMCRIYLAAIEHEQVRGVYNAVAPTPVSNKVLVMTLAEKMKGRFYIPFHVPSFVLKIMLGKMSIEVLKSTTVSCEKIHRTGFRFLYPTIDAALKAL